jgi:predicted nuclease of restriction endonuclease-like (RecB) superfamily
MPTKTRKSSRRRAVAKGSLPTEYASVLAEMKELVSNARRRSLAAVNSELVLLYWSIGKTIVCQQEKHAWGDGVVERLSADLRLAFPDMQGLSTTNLWKSRHFFLTYREMSLWREKSTLPTVSTELSRGSGSSILSTLSTELPPDLGTRLLSLSWSHHMAICYVSEDIAEQYFYLQMAVREHWSVRELKRQIASSLFSRYVSVASDPEKCLPEEPERGPLLPFKDHYVLDFLGLGEQHTERQLRKALLGNVRDLFLEFGREFALVGEEYPLTIGRETYRIDLLLFHRGLQCLVAVELKSGEFKPEHVGKCQFYLAALDECARLSHEKPSVGLILCKSAKGLHMRLALTLAARRVGVATYQTALPDEELIRECLEGVAA